MFLATPAGTLSTENSVWLTWHETVRMSLRASYGLGGFRGIIISRPAQHHTVERQVFTCGDVVSHLSPDDNTSDEFIRIHLR